MGRTGRGSSIIFCKKGMNEEYIRATCLSLFSATLQAKEADAGAEGPDLLAEGDAEDETMGGEL